ncbi:cold shock domain-containing protein CspD [Oceanicoccus sp. KOV_DT_Chl]|uniref:cold shock domain-containing protein CspD n=1 Tax=Oceanicoccus sp. KOV_DT_Chl TaxID=1904639 RepID=UPI000C7BCCC5|nr:cold shock domain-containing protein CspD [Oceanicoccus sp. KOV_DT_Chl]
MKTGIVKWFNNAKGFGFILPEGGGADIFAHYSSIDMDGYKTLKAGQTVTFDTINGPKGLHATGIQSANSESVAEVTQITTENS